MSNTVVKRIFSFVLTALVLAYVGYLFYSSNFTLSKTEIVYSITVEDTIDTIGIAVRDETVITDKGSGVISYAIDDGDKVNNGGIVARFYDFTQQTADMHEINRLNAEIEELEKLNRTAANLTTDIDAINKQINTGISDLMIKFNKGDYSNARSNGNLLYYINERLLVTGEIKNLNKRIKALKKQKSELESQNSASSDAVYAPVSGYFLSNVDGFENTVKFDEVESVDPKAFDKLKNTPTESSSSIGKLMESTDWYILCKISSKDALKISESGKKQFKLYIPFAVSGYLPVSLYAVNQPDKTGDAVIVLRCNRVNEETVAVRKETVQLAIYEYSGLRVSKKALHDATLTKTIENKDGSKTEVSEKVQGVYVQHGNELVFKQVVIIYSGTDYVICDPEPKEDLLFNGETIDLYDEIVVEGTDLYDGKIIN